MTAPLSSSASVLKETALERSRSSRINSAALGLPVDLHALTDYPTYCLRWPPLSSPCSSGTLTLPRRRRKRRPRKATSMPRPRMPQRSCRRRLASSQVSTRNLHRTPDFSPRKERGSEAAARAVLFLRLALCSSSSEAFGTSCWRGQANQLMLLQHSTSKRPCCRPVLRGSQCLIRQ